MVVEGFDVCQRRLEASEHPVNEKVQAVADLTRGDEVAARVATDLQNARPQGGRRWV